MNCRTEVAKIALFHSPLPPVWVIVFFNLGAVCVCNPFMAAISILGRSTSGRFPGGKGHLFPGNAREECLVSLRFSEALRQPQCSAR